MLRTGLMVFMLGGMMASAQAQDAAPAPADKVQAQDTNASSTDKIDRASAYYHYALAQLYYEMSFRSGGNQQVQQVYLDKASEEYEEAVKADPRTPRPVISPLRAVIRPAPKPLPSAPKSSPPPEQK